MYKGLGDGFSRLHPSLEDDSGGYFVDEGFVLSRLAADAALDHGAVCYHTGEALVEEFYGYVGQEFAQAVDEGRDASHILAVLAVHLSWLSHDNAFHWFAPDIVEDKGFQILRGNGGETVGDELQGIGDCQSCAFLSVVDGEDAHVVELTFKRLLVLKVLKTEDRG